MPTYRLLPRADDRRRGVAELVRRCLRAHGPATVGDFATWSGLPEAPVPADEPVRTEHGRLLPGTDAAGLRDTVRLPGPFDTFLLGDRDRALGLDPAHEPLIRTAGGAPVPHVALDGQVRDAWRRRAGRIVVEQFGRIPVSELDVEVESVPAWA